MARRFSRRTVIAATDVIDGLTQAKLSSFLIELGPGVYRQVRGEDASSTKRTNDLKQFYDKHPDYVVDGERLDDIIVEKAASLLPVHQPEGMWSPAPVLTDAQQKLLRTLSQDGYVVTDGTLRRSLPIDIGLQETESELVRLLGKHRLTVAKGHLDQAFDNHAGGNWAAANAQLRTFFDALLDEIAVMVDPAAASCGTGQPRRGKLAAAGFFFPELNEWDNDGKGYFNGFVKRLHPAGSHPGLSDDDDCTYRLHMVLLTALLLLRRYDRGRVG